MHILIIILDISINKKKCFSKMTTNATPLYVLAILIVSSTVQWYVTLFYVNTKYLTDIPLQEKKHQIP